MKLERITLDNFRQYYGRQRLEFARDPERRVTVIHGINGAGKTSLFLAINWCLYGTRVENVKVIDNVGELISKEAINRASEGERVRASVELTFLHNGDRYVVRRLLQGTKRTNNTVDLDNAEEFLMMRTGSDGQAIRVNNPIGTMNAILPVNVREYFLFDGEKIDNFAKPEASDQVRQAIYLVLKLEILERARRHLDSAAKEYRRDLKQVSNAELKNLLDKADRARTERSKAEKRKTEVQQEIESARRKIEDIDRRLLDMQNAKALQQQRDRVERDLKQRRSESESVISRVRDLATGGYFIVAQPAIDRALQILNEKRERGEIPSSIRQHFIQDLLEQMRCICGRLVTDGSPEHERLLNLMNRSMPGSLEDDILDTASNLRPFAERIERQRAEIDLSMKRRAELVDIIKALEAELDDVGRQLKGSPLEEVSKLEEQRQGFLADIDSNNVEIGSLTERIEKMSKDIGELEKAIQRAQKAEQRGQLLGMKLDLAQRAADAIGDMYAVFADDMRQRIEVKTRDIFKLLVWKDSHFHDVRLGPEFNLEVIDRYERPARPELSAGERQVLSISFITAMSRISEEEAPLVMDTPFGRLSSHHRNSIAKHIPELADQLVLFVTDEELRDEARANLESRIGAEYRLEFSHTTSCTEIVEVRR